MYLKTVASPYTIPVNGNNVYIPLSLGTYLTRDATVTVVGTVSHLIMNKLMMDGFMIHSFVHSTLL